MFSKKNKERINNEQYLQRNEKRSFRIALRNIKKSQPDIKLVLVRQREREQISSECVNLIKVLKLLYINFHHVASQSKSNMHQCYHSKARLPHR